METDLTFNAWLVKAVSEYGKSPYYGHQSNHQQRLGQWLFNTLHGDRPDIANYLRGGPHDPFNVDNRIEFFLEEVEEMWKLT